MTEKKNDKSNEPEDCSNDDYKNSRWHSTFGKKGDRRMVEKLKEMMKKGKITECIHSYKTY